MTRIRIHRDNGITAFDVAAGSEPLWGERCQLAHFELELRNAEDIAAPAAFVRGCRVFKAVWDKNVAGCTFSVRPGAEFAMATGDLGQIKLEETATGAYVWCWGFSSERERIEGAMNALMRLHLQEKIASLQQAACAIETISGDGLPNPGQADTLKADLSVAGSTGRCPQR